MAHPNTDKLTTHFVDQGTLIPPGPIGRLVRLGFGLMVLYPVVSLAPQMGVLLQRTSVPTHWSWWLTVGIGLWLFPYVINIGFTVNLRGWPRALAAVIMFGTVGLGFAITGATWSAIAAVVFALWIGYTFGHLGVSFLLASALATPGCEMRAIPHLSAMLSGRATKEHYCPGVMDPIDRWERNLRRRT